MNNKVFTILLCCFLISCEDFLEIEAPDHKMVSEVVFDSDEMALSAMKGIYNELFNASFSGGSFNSVTVVAGLSAEDLSPIRSTSYSDVQLDEHDILPDNSKVLNLWTSAYNIIYLTNSLLEGIENSDNISSEILNQIKGEASFVRAFTHFYLVNLFGDIPIIITSNYQENALAARNSNEEIYAQILTDLHAAEELLGDDYSDEERTKITRFTAIAMLARIHLYLENWSEAERLSSEVIARSGTYEILEDLDHVFLANSREAIWQLSPEGRGTISTHTNEGAILIINPGLSFLATIKLGPSFVTAFDPNDKRLSHWVGSDAGLGVEFANKYKLDYSTSLPIEEHSMVLRLAEQYLIRAEARVLLGDLNGAIEDIDKIRKRAGMSPISTKPQPMKEQVLELILEERKRELFAEWGHRWLDLKRTGRIGNIISTTNPKWEETDALYPIPETEVMKNSNLQQNSGY